MTEIARDIDHFSVILTILCASVTLGLFMVTAWLCWKYRARDDRDRGDNIQNRKLEIAWTAGTFAIFIGIFLWATMIYRKEMLPPEAIDYEIFVYGKRWMWKVYHQTGHVEVNEIHLPEGKTIRLKMISKDVIHSFYLPAFRIKQDVLPNTYTFLHLRPEASGKTPLYCTEYCGSQHSGMVGSAHVVPEKEYIDLIHKGKTLAKASLLKTHGCLSCHGDKLEAFSQYSDARLRESLLRPKEEMPSYKDSLSEEEIHQVINELKLL